MNSVIGQIIVWIIAGYLLGSVSFGMLVGKDAGVDIRTKGSGNIGTTNALRTLGKKAALITFLGDFFKDFICKIQKNFKFFCGMSKKDTAGPAE